MQAQDTQMACGQQSLKLANRCRRQFKSTESSYETDGSRSRAERAETDNNNNNGHLLLWLRQQPSPRPALSQARPKSLSARSMD